MNRPRLKLQQRWNSQYYGETVQNVASLHFKCITAVTYILHIELKIQCVWKPFRMKITNASLHSSNRKKAKTKRSMQTYTNP